jgi:hypothetical protein
MFFGSVSQVEVERAILSLKTKTFCGIDGILSSLLKQSHNPILSVITELLNASLQSGIFPDIFKISNIIPVF